MWAAPALADHVVVKRHVTGADAPVIAAMRCDELLDAGDHEGARNYQAIIERINRLLEVPSGLLH